MIAEILLVSFIGGLLSLDVSAWGQIMVSRPIISGPIIGLLLGDLKTGLIIGVLLELIWINVISVGAAIPPNATIVAVTCLALIILTERTLPVGNNFQGSYRMVVLALTMPLGEIFKRIDIKQRKLNARFVHYLDREIIKGNLKAVERVNYFSLFLFFLKGLLFSLVAISVGLYILPKLFSYLPFAILVGLNFAYRLLPALGLAIAFNTFRGL
ncbi:MAG: PTS sugar transporter subunit IIC [Elusimicrobiota bacterium]|nr:PTS sugar transporter subunit IIC [Elusimicrobiota bacterium]MDH5661897.1 PTS sugar transporter subunit IIC [Elusimicrobiota bacterium]